ncbi:uncharacterized protein F4807DRAFT_162160 [Annulohypoxylon truncatum]|uniref:uncharacterized protein n=1 Tax=Annulohypoxylon truncatum TaxID=327061 RepID=UPI0020086FFC|nr:uncharacterized protein F4807DRAFT_162160 [Annulohypoxylon truncatum]KAI1208018.1 hypothetical protein F4807DRAFT_162160 [Annulohypoxylon truncatum]
MSARQLIQSLSDIVRDSRLETEIFSAYTQHTVYVSGYSARERHVPKEERWVRDRFLGQGAYGTVHLERCEQRDGTAKLRAVKQIKKYNVAGKELEYMRELEAISKFSHNRYSHCFVRSHGWFENSESVFITMEYLEKGDLHKYLTRPLPESETRAITSQVLEGLKFMHENGFVHRDLKPGNIMVVTTGPDWFVKIADFGISKRRQQDVTSLHTLQMGTLGFAAPETMGLRLGSESRSYTAAVDLWSLGACVYIMLMNDLPFSSIAELFQYVNGMLSFPTRNLQSQSITDQGQQFIITLMSPDPKARPSSENAETHPWMTTDLPAHLGDIKPGDTMLSAASAAWSSTAEQAGEPTEKAVEADSEKQIEEPAKDKTVLRPEDPRRTSLSPFYRQPYIDNCNDEFEETSGGLLPTDSPYVLDDADVHSPTMSGGLPSHISLTPSPEPNDGPPTMPLKKLPNLSLGVPEDLLTPNLISRPRSPYFVQVGEKMDISHVLNHGRSKSTTENENRLQYGHVDDLKPNSQHCRSSSAGDAPQSTTAVEVEGFARDSINQNSKHSPTTDKHGVSETSVGMDKEENGDECDTNRQALVLHNRAFSSRAKTNKDLPNEVDPEAYRKGLLYLKGTEFMPCAYCGLQCHIFHGGIRLVQCGHWICHYCLIERFILVLISRDYELRCCEMDINLKSFNRILVDPRINRLWSARRTRKYKRIRYLDDFIISLYEKGVLRDSRIIADIQAITGLVFFKQPNEYGPHGTGRHQAYPEPPKFPTSRQPSPRIRPTRKKSQPELDTSSRYVSRKPQEPYMEPFPGEGEEIYSSGSLHPRLVKKYTSITGHIDLPSIKTRYTPRQYTDGANQNRYGGVSEEEDSELDPVIVDDGEPRLVSHRYQDTDLIAHNAGHAGQNPRNRTPYIDMYSWLNEVENDEIPDTVTFRYTVEGGKAVRVPHDPYQV